MNLFNKPLFVNILVMLGILAVLFLIISTSLKLYTKHGKESYLPQGRLKDFNKTYDIMDSLGFDVEYDSTFNIKYKPGQIISQTPKGGVNVKKGRSVNIVYNKYIRPKVRLPNFQNMSLRSASILLNRSNLIMGDTLFKHDITKGIILEQWVNGRKVLAGSEVPVGVRVSFLVSAGLGEPNIPMQLLIGKTYPEALAFLRVNELNPQVAWLGMILDTANAKVVQQYPMQIDNYNQRNYVAAGEYINLSVMQNPSDSLLKRNSHVDIIQLPSNDIEDPYSSFEYTIPSNQPDDSSSASTNSNYIYLDDTKPDAGEQTPSPDVPTTNDVPETNPPATKPNTKPATKPTPKNGDEDKKDKNIYK